MAEDKGQAGKGDDRKDNPGDGPNDVVTGASNGDAPALDVKEPAPKTVTPKAADSGTAVAEKPVTPTPAGGEATAEEKGTTEKKGPDAVTDSTNELQKGGKPNAEGTAKTTPDGAKKEGDEYRRDDAPAEEDAAPSESAVRDTKKARTLLNNAWGLQWPDPVMLKIMQTGSVTKSSNGITFDLEDGGKVKWHQNLHGQGEFVGKTGFFTKMNEKEAEATIAICKNRGWKKVTLYGSVEQKERLWLEAKKQEMEVTNFAPMADSPILQEWAKYQATQTDKKLAGVSNGEKPPMEIAGNLKLDDTPKGTTAEAAEKQKGPGQQEPTPTPASAEDGQAPVIKSSIAGNLTPRPTTDAPATSTESTARKDGESLQDFFSRKIDEATHPKLKANLGKMRDALSAPGTDEALVKEVCDKLGAGRISTISYNEAASLFNEKNPQTPALAKLGERSTPGPKPAKPG